MKSNTRDALEKVSFEQESKARRNCFRVWTLIGAVILAIGLGYVLNILAIPVGIILWTTIIVFILRTPVNRFEKWGLNRSLGTLISYIGLFVILGVVGLVMFSPAFGVGEQFMSLIQSIPGYFDQLSQWYYQISDQYSNILQNEAVANWLNDAANSLGIWASDMARNSAGGLMAAGGTVLNSFMVIGFSTVVAFWILMDLPALGKECRRFISEKHQEDAQMIYITFTRVMGGYIRATMVQCLLIGVGCGVAFALIGVPNAAALGGITGILNIIPVVGPWLGGALAAIVGVFVSPWVAIIALVITVAIQQIIYTFVSPKLMSSSVDVHPAIVILALLAGSAIGGAMGGLMGSVVGMLASIPAVAAFKSIFVYYFEKNTGRRIVAEDGVFFKGTPAGEGKRGFSPAVDTAPASAGKPTRPMKADASTASGDKSDSEGNGEEDLRKPSKDQA